MAASRPPWWIVAAPLAAALVLRGPAAVTRGLDATEIAWLARPDGLLARIVDSWVGSIASDVWMRLPLLLPGAIAASLVALALRRVAGNPEALGLGLAVALLPSISAHAGQVGAGGAAALIAALALYAAARDEGTGGPPPHRLWPLAVVALPLGPALAAAPLGAALGLRFGRSLRGLRVLAIATLLLVVALLVDGPALGWHAQASGRFAQQALLLVAAAGLAAATLGRPAAAAGPLVRAAAGAALLSLLWLGIAPLRRLSDVPLAAALICLPVAACGLPRAGLRWRRAGIAFAVVAALAGWWSNHGRAMPTALPWAETVAELRRQAPRALELLVDPALSAGALRHVTRGTPLTVVQHGESPRVARIHPAAVRPAAHEAQRLRDALGGRVLERHGWVESPGGSLRWAEYRPVELQLDAEGPRPDVAIISVDTLRADRLSLYGYPRRTSPEIDGWAAGAQVYERAASTAGETCPSFASVLTGRLPAAHGVRSNVGFLDPGNWTLAEVLGRAGYESAAFVSSSLLYRGERGLEDGFDLYDDRLDRVERNRPRARLRVAPDLAAAVRAWLDARRAGDRPWFLWVHAMDPHGPYTPLPEFADTFAGDDATELRRDEIPDYQWLDSTRLSTYVDAYDAEVRQTDAHLGPLIRSIVEQSSPRGTLLFFLADHGEGFGEHGYYFAHGRSVHQEEIHVPLVVYDSAAPTARRIRVPVSLVDVFPTVLRRLGISSDLPLDGISLDERVHGGAVVLGGWRPGQVAAYRGSLKLLLDTTSGLPRVRLHDLDSDAAEIRPLAGGAELAPELFAAVEAMLSADPLTGAGRILEREQWEGLSPEEVERLRSLGYVAP